MPNSVSRCIKIVVCYAHLDRAYKVELDKAWSSISNARSIEVFSDTSIATGDWAKRIAAEIDEAEIVVCLITRNFMASPRCREELNQALKRYDDAQCVLLPIRVHRTEAWSGDGRLARLHAIPDRLLDDAGPHDFWNDVHVGLVKSIDECIGAYATPTPRGLSSETDISAATARIDSVLSSMPPSKPRIVAKWARRAPLVAAGLLGIAAYQGSQLFLDPLAWVWIGWPSRHISSYRQIDLDGELVLGDAREAARRAARRERGNSHVLLKHEEDGKTWLQAPPTESMGFGKHIYRLNSSVTWTRSDFVDMATTERPIGVITPINAEQVSTQNVDGGDESSGPCSAERSTSALSADRFLAGLTLAFGVRVYSEIAARRGTPSTALQVLSKADQGAPACAAQRVNELRGREPGILALVGSYDSRVTNQLMKSCRSPESPDSSECGPILSLSSAVSLRSSIMAADTLEKPRDPDCDVVPALSSMRVPDRWLFRLTLDNHDRALALTRAIETLPPQSGEPSRVYVIYHDDDDSDSEVNYARDQACRLKQTLPGSPLPRWISFRRLRGQPLPTGFFDETPKLRRPEGGVRRRKEVSFSELLDTISREDSGNTLIIFVALDEDIVNFARAFGLDGKSHPTVRWYVPGPREVFEREWRERFSGPYLRSMERVRVLTPDDPSLASLESYDFTDGFREVTARSKVEVDVDPEQPPSSRAARIYDALHVLRTAMQSLDDRFRNDGVAFVHRQLYRAQLRDEIQRTRYQGASGLISFKPSGDLLGPAYISEMRCCRLHPLAVWEQPSATPSEESCIERCSQ